MVQYLK